MATRPRVSAPPLPPDSSSRGKGRVPSGVPRHLQLRPSFLRGVLPSPCPPGGNVLKSRPQECWGLPHPFPRPPFLSSEGKEGRERAQGLELSGAGAAAMSSLGRPPFPAVKREGPEFVWHRHGAGARRPPWLPAAWRGCASTARGRVRPRPARPPPSPPAEALTAPLLCASPQARSPSSVNCATSVPGTTRP